MGSNPVIDCYNKTFDGENLDGEELIQCLVDNDIKLPSPNIRCSRGFVSSEEQFEICHEGNSFEVTVTEKFSGSDPKQPREITRLWVVKPPEDELAKSLGFPYPSYTERTFAQQASLESLHTQFAETKDLAALFEIIDRSKSGDPEALLILQQIFNDSTVSGNGLNPFQVIAFTALLYVAQDETSALKIICEEINSDHSQGANSFDIQLLEPFSGAAYSFIDSQHQDETASFKRFQMLFPTCDLAINNIEKSENKVLSSGTDPLKVLQSAFGLYLTGLYGTNSFAQEENIRSLMFYLAVDGDIRAVHGLFQDIITIKGKEDLKDLEELSGNKLAVATLFERIKQMPDGEDRDKALRLLDFLADRNNNKEAKKVLKKLRKNGVKLKTDG